MRSEQRPANQLRDTTMTPNLDRKSTRLNSSHSQISYAVFCLKKKHAVHVGAVLREKHHRARAAPARLVDGLLATRLLDPARPLRHEITRSGELTSALQSQANI